MGEAVVSKKVSFVGAWKVPSVSDQLLKQINSGIASKQTFPATLTLTVNGMELLILGKNGIAARKDNTPLENVVDLTDNKFSTNCTLAIVRDKQQKNYTVLVFVCASDRDAHELIQGFKKFKRQLSGEGYNVDVTSKGQNWTLVTNKQQYEIRTPVNQQNGNVIRMNGNDDGAIHVNMGGLNINENDHNKVELRNELVHLAGEIRDIKRILHQNSETQQYHYPQTETTNHTYIERTDSSEMPFAERRAFRESKGRMQFEKHYGYRILQQAPPPKMQSLQTIESPTVSRPVQDGVIYTKQVETTKRPTVYIKKSKQSTKTPKHFVAVSPSKNSSVRSRSTYYTTASVPPSPTSSMSYTKRVYDSANPYMYATQRVHGQPLTLVATNKKYRFRQRSPLRKAISLGSDIVPRNIEDVYKHRTMKRIIVPPPVSPSVTEYVNVQSTVGAPSSVHYMRTRDNTDRVEHVEYVDTYDEQVNVPYPSVRGVYETREDLHQNASFANMSTAVNLSNDDGLDDNVIMRGEDYRDLGTDVERQDDVVVIRADTDHASSYRQAASHNGDDDNYTIEARFAETTHHEEPKTIGGEIYHVKAVSVEEYERTKEYGDDVTVISASSSHMVHNAPPMKSHFDIQSENSKQGPVVLSVNTNGDTSNHHEVNGLFGAYAKKPDHVNDEDEIVATKTYRYHDDDNKSESSAEIQEELFGNNIEHKSSTANSVKSESDIEDSAVKHVHYSNEDEHIIDKYTEEKNNDSDEESENGDEMDGGIENTNNEIERNDEDEDEDDYELDMDAVRQSMEEPEVEILSSNTNGTTNSISYSGYSATYHSEGPSTSGYNDSNGDVNVNGDDDEKHSGIDLKDRSDTLSENEHSENENNDDNDVTKDEPKSAADKDAFARQFLDEDAIRLITNRTENSVLF